MKYFFISGLSLVFLVGTVGVSQIQAAATSTVHWEVAGSWSEEPGSAVVQTKKIKVDIQGTFVRFDPFRQYDLFGITPQMGIKTPRDYYFKAGTIQWSYDDWSKDCGIVRRSSGRANLDTHEGTVRVADDGSYDGAFYKAVILQVSSAGGDGCAGGATERVSIEIPIKGKASATTSVLSGSIDNSKAPGCDLEGLCVVKYTAQGNWNLTLVASGADESTPLKPAAPLPPLEPIPAPLPPLEPIPLAGPLLAPSVESSSPADGMLYSDSEGDAVSNSVESSYEPLGKLLAPAESSPVPLAAPQNSRNSAAPIAVRVGAGQQAIIMIDGEARAQGTGTVVVRPNLSEGRHVLRVVVTDQSGQQKIVERVIVIDKTPPAVPFSVVSGKVAAGSILRASSVYVYGPGADNEQTEADGTTSRRVRVSLAGMAPPDASAVVVRVESTPQDFSCALDRPAWQCNQDIFLTPGQHKVSVASRDAAGNTSVFVSVEEIVVPVAVVLPANGAARTAIAVIQQSQETTNELRENKAVVGSARNILSPGATTASVAPFFSILAVNSLGLLDIPSALVFFFLWLLEQLHLRRRRATVGRAYDSVSKEALPLARFHVYSQNKKQFVARALSNFTGEYGLPPLPAGDQYYVQVVKPRYDFPSQLIRSRLDKPYQNIYRGEEFRGSNTALTFDVPLDPSSARPRSRARAALGNVRSVLVEGFHLIANIVLATGALISLGTYFIVPRSLHLVMFGFYVLLILLAYLSRRAHIKRLPTVRLPPAKDSA